MGIELVVNKYKKVEKDPEKIWANTELDELRRKECLCFNCDRKNEEKAYSSCPVVATLYAICVEHSMAIAITKCGAIGHDGALLYKPLK